MSSNSNSSNSGMGILGVLQIVFIVLKLCGVIKWGWLTVFIPLWIEIGLVLLVVLLLALSGKSLKSRRNRSGKIKW
jgi:membrane protein implicated in regulation of membrane protease activity